MDESPGKMTSAINSISYLISVGMIRFLCSTKKSFVAYVINTPTLLPVIFKTTGICGVVTTLNKAMTASKGGHWVVKQRVPDAD